MGKTPKPLSLLVHPDLYPWPELDKMAEQGHTIDRMGSETKLIWEYNIIFGGNAWWMVEELKKHLPTAVKRARELQYGQAKKAAKKDKVRRKV